MVVLGNDSYIDKSTARKGITWRTQTEAELLGNAADGIGIYAGISDIFPCRGKLRGERVELLENNSMDREYADEIGGIQVIWEECVIDE